MAKNKENIVNEARALIDGLDDFKGDEADFIKKVDRTLNDWKEAQTMQYMDRRMIPLTVEEVSEILKVKPRVVSDLLKKGILKGGKVGKEWRVLQGDLEDYLIEITSGEKKQ